MVRVKPRSRRGDGEKNQTSGWKLGGGRGWRRRTRWPEGSRKRDWQER